MNKKLIQYFWKNANKIVSHAGIEIVLHRETIVEVSVLLRNHEEYKNRIQVRMEFNSLEEFVQAFNIVSPDDINRISIKNLLVLYQKGVGELDEIIYPT